MKKVVSLPRIVMTQGAFSDIHTGQFTIINKPNERQFNYIGGIRTKGLGTCVGILINTPTQIGLGHCDTFFVAKNANQIINGMNSNEPIEICLAYNPYFHQQHTPISWKTDFLQECDPNIHTKITFFAVSGTKDYVGITLKGLFVELPYNCQINLSQSLFEDMLAGNTDNQFSTATTSRFFELTLLGSKTLSYQPLNITQTNSPFPKLGGYIIPTAETTEDAEKKVEPSALWIRKTPINPEWIGKQSKNIYPFLVFILVTSIIDYIYNNVLNILKGNR